MPRRRADMLPAEIRYALNRKGKTFADVDRAYSLKEGTARRAARQPHAEGEAALAETLGRPACRIWPSRYDAAGTRLKPQPIAHYTNPPTIRASQKADRKALNGVRA